MSHTQIINCLSLLYYILLLLKKSDKIVYIYLCFNIVLGCFVVDNIVLFIFFIEANENLVYLFRNLWCVSFFRGNDLMMWLSLFEWTHPMDLDYLFYIHMCYLAVLDKFWFQFDISCMKLRQILSICGNDAEIMITLFWRYFQYHCITQFSRIKTEIKTFWFFLEVFYNKKFVFIIESMVL